MAVRAVTLFVNSELHDAQKWSDYYRLYELPAYQAKAANGAEENLAQQIERKMRYRFKYPRLLRSAMTHSTAAWSIPSYQRLEFLGDSLLDMVCINYLYHKYPDRDPQWLTEHKVRKVPEFTSLPRLTFDTDGHGLEQVSRCCCCRVEL